MPPNSTSTTGSAATAASSAGSNDGTTPAEPTPVWKLKAFASILMLDTVTGIITLSPLWSWMRHTESVSNHFTFYSSLMDLAILSALRVVCCKVALLGCYWRKLVPSEHHFDLYHPNGERKTREQLEHEALEEPFWPWFQRFLWRPCFAGEILAVVTQIVCIVKCLLRMNVEIGTLEDAEPLHPVFWLAILLTAVLSVVEATYLQDMCKIAGQYGKETGSQAPLILRSFSSQLLAPLLNDQNEEEANGESGNTDDGAAAGESTNDENVRAASDITADPTYKASWSDVLMICYHDVHLICVAFVFLLLAAVAQIYIPKFLGNILDALGAAFADPSNDSNRHMSMWDVPHFISNIKLLVVASVCAGIFAGLRGSIFTVVGARINVRLRVKLMDALLSQDIGFFDVVKAGELSSRLSSDTTLVGDQISLNVNVFLRSLVQSIGVLLFMFLVSWQLTILAFISVPLITLLSKWYGDYVRALTKVMQQKLADGNAVSEAALGSMATVRSFDAAEKELSDFEGFMSQYLHLNLKSAIAYNGYATIATTLPELIFAVVVFYGGMLVRNGDMTSGELVSFLLYLQSLSDAFATLGWVFTSLMQAVGAADKVFELMHRKPRITPPTTSDTAPQRSSRVGILGIEATKTKHQRTYGKRPEGAKGEIVLDNVTMYYPARPNRRVLDGLSLRIEPGSTVALVGQSGGGKSSVMSLIQHLYEQSSGTVLFDGVDVRDLSPEWLSRNISIVSQEPTLFARSIKKNIMYGLEGTDAEPSDDEIIAAAKLANADSFIQTMPQKYDTEVGERGVQLSGGQKQRIAIARALVRRPRVLLLDEATSALDAESEHLVQQAIDEMLARGKGENGGNSMTVVIVAHRLSTVRSADCIFVIKDGQVVEQGTHDNLIQVEDGAYSALISRQMQAQKTLENHGDENGKAPEKEEE